MADRDAIAREIEQNLEFFRAQLGELIEDHSGRYALLHHQQIAGIYDTIRDAKTAGDKLYPDGIFSVQKVSDKPVELGVFSYAMHMGQPQ